MEKIIPFFLYLTFVSGQFFSPDPSSPIFTEESNGIQQPWYLSSKLFPLQENGSTFVCLTYRVHKTARHSWKHLPDWVHGFLRSSGPGKSGSKMSTVVSIARSYGRLWSWSIVSWSKFVSKQITYPTAICWCFQYYPLVCGPGYSLNHEHCYELKTQSALEIGRIVNTIDSVGCLFYLCI